MEFRKIIYFLKVAETLNFRRAAEELFISPQALSKHIRDLEQVLGYSLFRRSTTKVELTEDGTIFYTRFCRLWKEWQNAWKESTRKPTVRFCYFIGSAESECLQSLINVLAEQYSEWELEMAALDLAQVVRNIQNGQADLGYTAIPDSESYAGCEQFPIQKLPTLVYMPQNHPLVEYEHVTMEDLLRSKFLFVKGTEIRHGSIFDTIKEHGHTVYVNDNISLMSAIRTGKGIALLPVQDQFLKYPGITARPLEESIQVCFVLGLVWKKGHMLDRHFRQIGSQLRMEDCLN